MNARLFVVLGGFTLLLFSITTVGQIVSTDSERALPPVAPGVVVKVLAPQQGAYQGAFADFGPVEETVTADRILKFESLAQKKMAWAYFSDNWLGGTIRFPTESVETCRKLGVIPYIRLSPWSEMVDSRPDKIFSMQKIIAGRFDPALRVWAQAARDSGSALMIEFGPEVNGDWFPWNGRWNGAGQTTGYGDRTVADGPERFRDAYRHLIDLFRAERAFNVTWVLHVDVAGSPESSWNDVKNYYPGDDYIDWIGVSVFGAQLPKNNWILFPGMLKRFWHQLDAATTSKPILVSEFGVIEDHGDPARKAKWIHQALQSVSRGMFKRVKGVTYWNSPGWLTKKQANLAIDSSPSALDAYRAEISQPFWLTGVDLGNGIE